MSEPGQGDGEETRNQLVERFLVQQDRELAIRAQELEIEKQKDDHSFEFGKAALATQAEDRKHERDCKIKEVRHRHRLVLMLTAIVAALILLTIYLGQPAIALEIAKYIGLLLAGGLGGYGFAKAKSKPPSDDSQ